MDKLLDLPLSRKFLLFFLLSVLICGGCYFLLIRDAQSTVQGLHSRLNRQRQELDQIKKQFTEEKLLAAESRHEDLKKQVEANEKLLPTRDEVAEFIMRIKEHADASGLTVARFDVLDKLYEEQYAMVPVKMETIGDTVQLVKFFQTLAEPTERLVNIEELSIRWVKPTTGMRNVATEDADLAEAERLTRTGELRRLEPELVAKVQRVMDIELEHRYGKINATFTVNAFTFLTPEERANLATLKRRR